ncbi:MAG: BMP family ABC transporter substrate-binding protein, partial [Chloroflexia bacterium]|nr:BMP family ABC transporter substrate-binding protein [Chloroflexia bacterium]
MLIVVALLSLVFSACAAKSSAPAADEKFVFGLVLVGPINDGGWSQAHYDAAKYVESKIPGSQMVYVDKVNPADRPNVKVEQVVDELIAKGAKLIVTTSDDFKDGTRESAKAHPGVTFVHASGDDVLTGKAPANLGNMMGRMEYGKMIAGCAAALQSATGNISFIGPLVNDETRRLADSAFLGAKYCWNKRGGDPAALKFNVTWIGFWFNIPGVTLDPTKVVNDFFTSG